MFEGYAKTYYSLAHLSKGMCDGTDVITLNSHMLANGVTYMYGSLVIQNNPKEEIKFDF